MERKSIELEYALYYAGLGWRIIPLHCFLAGRCSCGDPECPSPAKHPRIRGGVASATTDPDTIRIWWRRWPGSNIGTEVGRRGMVVIDIDPQHGGRVEDLPLSDTDLITPTARTGGGGLHLIWRAPFGLTFSNSSKRLPDGIHVRADRAYIVASPSLHVSGRRYAWQPGRAPWEVESRPLPNALLPLLKIKQELCSRETIPVPRLPDSSLNGEGRHPYVAAALRSELDKVTGARESTRNNTLNESAFNLGQFIEAGLLPRDEVEILLENAALAIGLGEVETHRTVKSGIEAGMRNPRRNWPDLS
jgi:hypothetical protein